MKKLFWIPLIASCVFLSACGVQATSEVNAKKVALTVVFIASTAAAQTMEAMLTSSPIPTPTALITPTSGPTMPTFNYIVNNPSETCADIAIKFNISVKSIIVLNKLSDNCDIHSPEGRVLKIPYPTPTPVS